MELGPKTTVASIVAPLTKIINKLDTHITSKQTEVKGLDKVIEEKVKKKVEANTEITRANAYKSKINNFLNIEDIRPSQDEVEEKVTDN